MRCTIHWSLLAIVNGRDNEGGIKLDDQSFSGICSWIFICVYHVPPLLKERLYLVRDKAGKKSLILQHGLQWCTLVQRSKKLEIDEKSNL